MPKETDPPAVGVAGMTAGRAGIFYGWWILAAGAVLGTINGAFYFWGMAVFLPPLIREFGWSRTALSGAFSISRLEAGIAGPLAGMCIDRWGSRPMMLIGLALMGAGFLLLSRIQSLEAFYLIFILFLSLGTGLGVTPSITAAVANWFSRRRALALGIIMCGYGLGGAASASLGLLVNAYGWRTTMVIMGIVILATGLPLALVMRHRPEQYGLSPDGDPPAAMTPAGRRPGIASVRPAEAGFEPLAALRTRAFYLLGLVFGLRQLTTSGALVHLPALLVDRGYHLEVAAGVAGLVGLASVPGALLCGWLGDRFNKRLVFGACLALLVLSTVVLALGSSPLHLAVFVPVFGFATGGTAPLQMAIIADYFGRRRFATIFGLAHFAMMWGTIGGPLLAGYAFDTTGSYELALYTLAGANLVGLVVVFTARPPRAAAQSRVT